MSLTIEKEVRNAIKNKIRKGPKDMWDSIVEDNTNTRKGIHKKLDKLVSYNSINWHSKGIKEYS